MGLFVFTTGISDVAYNFDLVGWFSYVNYVLQMSFTCRFIAGSNGVDSPSQ